MLRGLQSALFPTEHWIPPVPRMQGFAVGRPAGTCQILDSRYRKATSSTQEIFFRLGYPHPMESCLPRPPSLTVVLCSSFRS